MMICASYISDIAPMKTKLAPPAIWTASTVGLCLCDEVPDTYRYREWELVRLLISEVRTDGS